MTTTPLPSSAPVSAARIPQQQPQPHATRRNAQRGISLYIVIVIVLLSMLLALWSSRTSLFNEMVVGNDADYQRAFEAAQALLQDAELDIREERADGQQCKKGRASDSPDKVCRLGTTEKIPLEGQDVDVLLGSLRSEPTKCRDALCSKRAGRQDFWNYTEKSTVTAAAGEVPLEDMTKEGIGARYGEYTGAQAGSTHNLLKDTSKEDRGGWYWIEVLPYDKSSENSGLIVSETPANDIDLLTLRLLPNVVYRITALVYGRKLNTMVVLQQTYARQKLKD